ncbi:MAG TPA: N-acetyltransferase [Sumerlaeia bacterium]|nr:N-acetyltransferase [Sumerlaeia bacterium]
MPNNAIRKASLADVPTIHRLIAEAAKTTPVIPRSQAEIYETLRDLFVYDEGDGVRGCCALHITWKDLAEVKSLAVDPAFHGRGIGSALARACLEEARSFGLPRVFALTAIPEFFTRLGFDRIEKSELPHKIWGECVRCPKFPDCDEEAVLIQLGEPTAAESAGSPESAAD